MDVASVLQAWDEVETEGETDDSDAIVESEEDAAAEEFVDESSGDEDNAASTTSPGPSTHRRPQSTRKQPVEYDWQEINEGK